MSFQHIWFHLVIENVLDSHFSDILYMNILQQIFSDNYEIIQYTLHPRDVELENIS